MNASDLLHEACQVCGRSHSKEKLAHGEVLPPRMVDQISRRQASWRLGQTICLHCLRQAREDYGQELMEEEIGELTETEMAVVKRFGEDTFLSENTSLEYERERSTPQRLADGLVRAIGSFWFSSAILLLLALWLFLNVGLRLFEPYPTIALAVISAALASLAAIQGPIILMSQRSQSKRDRLRGENDYQVNLKAELQIRYMGDKMDHMLKQQSRMHQELHEELTLMAQMLKRLEDRTTKESYEP